jgi:mannan endo-1,4-beta-mannosidase
MNLKAIRFLIMVLLLAMHPLLHAQPPAYVLCDKKANAPTKALYQNLKTLSAKGYLFGHQDDLAYGVNWRYENKRSDVKDACGDYPALYGWDLGGIENDGQNKNLDGVPFDSMRVYIKTAYKRGGVITITWHHNNPLTGGNAWDNKPGAVASVLPGAPKHALYTTWLDKVAAFLLSLRGEKNELIPVLFRPYHELSGSWFWWGKNNCSAAEFKMMWQFTKKYLTDSKGCHNLIYVYNTGTEPKTKAEFMERYPGNDMADVMSFDNYQGGDPASDNNFINNTTILLNIIDSAAAENNKLTAIAETGYEAIPYATWWTEVLQKAIGAHHIAYVLVWRNHGYQESTKKMHYYAPYQGQVSQNDFIKFYIADNTFFEKDAAKENLYQNKKQPALLKKHTAKSL